MRRQAESTFFQAVASVTHAYFGAAAHRFVAHQIRIHLRKKPEQLRTQDLASLIDWISVAMSFLNEDKTELIGKYMADLKRLSLDRNSQGPDEVICSVIRSLVAMPQIKQRRARTTKPYGD